MSNAGSLGLGSPFQKSESQQGVEHVIIQRPLNSILAFTGRSIDDVVNDPIAKRTVLGYYKVYKYVQRGCEITDLERWWNGPR